MAQDAGFSADLVDTVDPPFAVAVRSSADDDDSDSDDGDGGGDFVAWGEFGGAVAGDEIVIPLVETDNSGYAGLVVLTQGGEGEASTYVYNREMAVSEDGDDATPTSQPDRIHERLPVMVEPPVWAAPVLRSDDGHAERRPTILASTFGPVPVYTLASRGDSRGRIAFGFLLSRRHRPWRRPSFDRS